MKVCKRCLDEISTNDGDNYCTACQGLDGISNELTGRKKAMKYAREESYEMCGMEKVEGACGGIYFE